MTSDREPQRGFAWAVRKLRTEKGLTQSALARRVGLDPEGRKYTPHVTLARLRNASSYDVADYLSVRGYFPTRVFTASRFVLFSSRASTGGGPYVVEDSYALSA